MENSSLIKSTRIIGGATLVSRVLGFIRDVLIAKLFGVGASAQAFVVAFRLPNLLRSVVGEGSANAAVVPVLARLHQEGKEKEFWQTANSLLSVLLILLGLLTILGEIFAPYIVRAIAPGFIKNPAKLVLTIKLTRIIFPYILLIGLVAYAMAVLNSLKHFTLPALAPCMLNLSLITALIFCSRLAQPIFGLGIGVLVGGILQLGIQLPLLIKKGLFRYRTSDFLHPKVKQIGRLLLPRTLGVAVYQANIFIDTILASFTQIVGFGAPAALYYATRLVQFPLSLFGVALAQVALPTMSALAVEGDIPQLKKMVSFSLRSVFMMMVPATVGLAILAHPLIEVIFERGSFTSYSTDITSSALLFYSLSLTGYAGIKILGSCFYSLQDTATPAKMAGCALLINLALNLMLMWQFKLAGLALATSISVSVNFLLLLSALRKKIGKIDGFWPSLGRVSIASIIMGFALWFIFYRCEAIFNVYVFLPLKVLGSITIASAIYFGALRVVAPEEAGVFAEWILRRK